MYISLGTIDVWEIDGDFKAITFLKALRRICLISDILVIGSYNPEEKVLKWLLENEIQLPCAVKPFSDNFDLNRDEYPKGKAYAFYLGDREITELSLLTQVEKGSVDKKLFFEHLLIYRPNDPIIPLLNFHDSFMVDNFIYRVITRKK
jgi:hypothetical protein